MNGRRVYPNDKGELWLQPGDYGIDPRDGHWYARAPTGDMGNLSAHEVTEHPDGTITVSPSIAISDDQKELWHGYLERGEWRKA